MTKRIAAISFNRKLTKRVSNETLEEQINYIAERGCSGNRRAWSCINYTLKGPIEESGFISYQVIIRLERKGVKPDEVLNKEIDEVVNFMKAAGEGAKYAKQPWIYSGIEANWDYKAKSESGTNFDVIDFEKSKTISEIEIPEVLVSGSDDEIEAYPAFSGIFGRGKHIRIIASSLKRMKATGGKIRNHILLWGLPACAKSHIMIGWQKVLGPGGYVTINANAATRAGIEKLFTDRFKPVAEGGVGCPPVIFIEEIEKSAEAILTVWLSVLDDRAEVRKINYRNQQKVDASVLCVSTANDKVLFDRLHGGRPGYPGALSSRFTKKLYVPRPDQETMRRILQREIEVSGGKKTWVEPCLDIAKELGTTDPRIIMSLLDGQDRLLTGGYRDDILSLHSMEMNKGFDNDEEDITS